MMINVIYDRGDPVVLEKYWRKRSEECSIVIRGWEMMSYIGDAKNKVCWYMLPEVERSIRRLHHVVGNAVTHHRYIVVGTGATQLFQASVFALSPSHPSKPINVLAAAPFYSVIFSSLSLSHCHFFFICHRTQRHQQGGFRSICCYLALYLFIY